jgi:chemotaxis signal transduction protein
MTIGILAEGVREVVDIRNGEVLGPSELGVKVDETVLSGVVKKGEEFLLRVDISAVLNADIGSGAATA